MFDKSRDQYEPLQQNMDFVPVFGRNDRRKSHLLDIRDYDMAMLYRFQAYFRNTVWSNHANIELMEVRDNLIFEGQDVVFPLLVLRRTQCPIIIKDQQSMAHYKSGDRRGDYRNNGKPTDITLVDSIYELKYQLDIFASERDNFDEIMIEAQENLLRYPYLTFDVNDRTIHGMSVNITFDSATDNSDLEGMTQNTPLFRGTLDFTIWARIYRKYRVYRTEEFIGEFLVTNPRANCGDDKIIDHHIESKSKPYKEHDSDMLQTRDVHLFDGYKDGD